MRTFIDNEYCDEEYEQFDCGSTRGWRDRPCLKAPSFPLLEDYELQFFDNEDGSVSCLARGLTERARQV